MDTKNMNIMDDLVWNYYKDWPSLGTPDCGWLPANPITDVSVLQVKHTDEWL